METATNVASMLTVTVLLITFPGLPLRSYRKAYSKGTVRCSANDRASPNPDCDDAGVIAELLQLPRPRLCTPGKQNRACRGRTVPEPSRGSSSAEERSSAGQVS